MSHNIRIWIDNAPPGTPAPAWFLDGQQLSAPKPCAAKHQKSFCIEIPIDYNVKRPKTVNVSARLADGTIIGPTDEEEAGMAVFRDKLSERLAFERQGVRLYEALLNKCQTLGESAPGPTLEDIEHIGSEELEHFLLIDNAITEIGGDPAVQSPCADVVGVTSLGILQVLTDPRSSLAQCLQAMLTAELTDNDGWTLLINLADNLGYDDLKAEFETALEHEEEHLVNVRNWLSECVLESAQV